jgi:putative flippase GtrA
MTIGMPRQFVRFVAVGVVNTGLFLVVYLAFRLVVSAGAATVLATVLTTVTGTSANGHVTFGVDGPVGMRHHLKSLAVTVLGMVITSAAVDTFGGSRLSELVVLVIASSVAGTVRFVLLRYWVFGSLLVLAPLAEEVEAGDAEDGLADVLDDVQQLMEVGADPVQGGQHRQHVLVEVLGQAR